MYHVLRTTVSNMGAEYGNYVLGTTVSITGAEYGNYVPRTTYHGF